MINSLHHGLIHTNIQLYIITELFKMNRPTLLACLSSDLTSRNYCFGDMLKILYTYVGTTIIINHKGAKKLTETITTDMHGINLSSVYIWIFFV